MAVRENVLCGSCCGDFNAAPKNYNETYVCRCGAPFFSQKVLGDHHLPTHPRCYMEIPMDFMEDHGSRFGSFVNFEEDASSTKRLKIGGNVHVGFRFEWKEFALAHGIEIGHIVVFTLTPKSRILVQVYKNGIPVMGTGDFLSPCRTNSVPSTGDMQESTRYTQQNAEIPKEPVKLPPAAVKFESHEQTQQRAEVPKEHAKHPTAVVKNESNEVDGHTQQKLKVPKEHAKLPPAVVKFETNESDGKTQQRAEASKEHPKPPSSFIDLDSDDDIEICEAEDWQKAKSSQFVLKTPHVNSMPDVKVKKEWIEAIEASHVQETLEAATTGSGDVSATSSSSASDRSWSPRRNALEQLVDEDSANGITRAALLHERGKCGVDDVDSGSGDASTGQRTKYGRGSSNGVVNCRSGTITRAQRHQVLDAAYSRMGLTIKCPRDIITLTPSKCFPYSAADLSKTSVGPLLVKGETLVKLVDKNKKEWAVKCNKKGVLSLGWIEFACAHLLDKGDVCVFEIINAEDCSLRVHTFRVLDTIDCERQDGQGEEGMSSKKTNLLSVLEGNTESSEGLASSRSDGGDGSDSEEDQGRKPSCERKGSNSYFRKTPNKGEGSAVENGQDMHNDDENEPKASCPQFKVQETNKVARKWHKEGTKRGRTYVSKRRPVTEAEKEKANKAARELQTSHPSFLKKLRKDVSYRSLILSPPKPFYRDHLPKCKYKATLIDENGDSWPIVINKERIFWKHFSLDHYLEEEDALVFELTDSREGHVTFLVHIFRVVDVKVTLTGKKGWAAHYRVVEGTKKEYWKEFQARRQALKNRGKKGAHRCNPPSGSSNIHEKAIKAHKKRELTVTKILWAACQIAMVKQAKEDR